MNNTAPFEGLLLPLYMGLVLLLVGAPSKILKKIYVLSCFPCGNLFSMSSASRDSSLIIV